jgi:hypothetical protein
MNDASQTPAKYARWDYLSFGKVRHSSFWGAIFGIIYRVFLGLCVCVAAFLLLGAVHPFIGLVSGIVLLIGIIGMKPSYGLWRGRCPHCENAIAMPPESVPGPFDCPICTKYVYLDDGHFSPVRLMARRRI